MDDKTAEKQLEQENPNGTSALKGLFHGGNLVLTIIGAVVALGFAALITWISIGAPPKEEKPKTGDAPVAVETKAAVKPVFKEGGRLCLVTLPELKRDSREPVTPKIRMIKVEAGSFAMGGAPGRKVALRNDFYIGETEVTQAQWIAVMGLKKSGAEAGKDKKSYYTFGPSEEHSNGSDDLPVDSLSWDEATAFCRRLNRDGFAPEGWMFTLPTETQWEFAARGGVKSRHFKYSGGDELGEVAWCRSNNGRNAEGRIDSPECGRNRAVKGKKPNELGLYDMNGNVSEWCLDSYEKDPAAIRPEFTVPADSEAVFRVIRGGNWYTRDDACTPALRSPMTQGGRGPYLGFRLALVKAASVPPEKK